MIWNWQRKHWPHFTYHAEDFLDYERQFFEKAGVMHGSIQHVAHADQQLLKIELMREEALTTSTIEAYLFTQV